ncbi:BSD domain-containing protein 1-A-like, partial [Diaphorina citri]|uniref:BSD domain-containing protein 1-A-like n=1 Tax=Diaphorina citri TaxID=121845 RepID=A0A3Q0JJK9_DIACI
ILFSLQSAEVLEFVKKDFDELSTTVKTEATNVVQQTTTVFRETLQLDKPESTASSMKKSVSTFLDQVSTVLNPSPDDEDEEAVVIHGTDVVPLTRLQVGKAQLYALSNDPDTYLKEIEPELLPRYEAWLELLEEQGNKQLSNEKLIKMLVNNPQLQDNFQNLVPNQR